MRNKECEIVMDLFLLGQDEIIFMFMGDIPAEREGNAGLCDLLQMDFCVGRYLCAELLKEEWEVEPFGLHGLLIPIIGLRLYFAAYSE